MSEQSARMPYGVVAVLLHSEQVGCVLGGSEGIALCKKRHLEPFLQIWPAAKNLQGLLLGFCL